MRGNSNNIGNVPPGRPSKKNARLKCMVSKNNEINFLMQNNELATSSTVKSKGYLVGLQSIDRTQQQRQFQVN